MAITKIDATFQISGTVPGTGSSVGNPVVGGNAGGVLFVDKAGNLGQSPTTFLWNATNSTLNIGAVNTGGSGSPLNPADMALDVVGSIRSRGVGVFTGVLDGSGYTTFPPGNNILTFQNYSGIVFASSVIAGITTNTTNSVVPGWSSTDAFTSTGSGSHAAGWKLAQSVSAPNFANQNTSGLWLAPNVSSAPVSLTGPVGATYNGLFVQPTFYNGQTTTNVALNISMVRDAGRFGNTDIGLFVDMRGLTNTQASKIAGVFLGGFVGISNAAPQALLDVTGDGSVILVPRKSTAGDPSGGINGAIYYNASSATFRGFQGGVWSSLASGGGSTGIGNSVISGTPNSILFVDASSNLAQDTLLLNYNNISKRLGVGTNSQDARIHSLVGVTGNMEGLVVVQTDVTNNPNAVRITNVGTGMGLAVYQAGNTPVSDVSAGAVYVDGTCNTGVSVNIYSNQSLPAANASLLRVHSANSGYSQPTVYIKADGTGSGTPSIRVDAPSPLLYLNETAQVSPAGLYALDVKNDFFRINGMNAAGTSFAPVVVVQRVDSGGVGQGATVGINTGSNTGNSTLQVNGSFATGSTLVSAPYTASKSDQYIRVDASASPNGLTITLPAVSGIAGRIYHITKVDDSTNFVGIAPSGTDTILRQSGYQLFSHEQAVGVSANGLSNWQPYGNIPYPLSHIGNAIDTGYTGNVSVANTAWAIGVSVTQPVTLNGIRLKVAVQSGNIDVGIYNRNGVRIASSGSVACPAVGKATVNFGNSAVLTTPGVYYLALSSDNITATFSASGVDSLIGVNSFASSFPLPSQLVLPGTMGAIAFSLVGIVNGGVTQ